ncbi:EamA family transporter RarD [Leucobacter tenebrionis]|uniref:EamA family transporter RarD n=1 Tax=Leucobacter tenebrionis TaxID=2873270 RepID=UPI001CA781E3|nr:EamA family transporter RarD [Leucobacter tenebrionis]QZY53110.1 EamA family transporter RarD [Leucobacter tenebrionis]
MTGPLRPGPLGSGGRGIAVSVASSVLFGGIYFVTPWLAPASAESIWGLRDLITIPVIALALVVIRQGRLITEIGSRIRRNPLLLLGILACGALVAAQLWVFSWAPLHGRGMQVALGYFLLPLVLVVVGRLLYKDRLAWWQWLAAGIAALGVGFELIRVGGISWETLLVALGYPVYFVLRRALGTAHLGGMFWEFVVLAPVAAVLLVLEVVDGGALAANPALWWAAPLFAVASGVALMFYIAASRLLTLSIFGLLSYLEPALLMVASMLNGERIAAGEVVIYGAIWVAVLVLVAGGIAQLRPRRGPRSVA